MRTVSSLCMQFVLYPISKSEHGIFALCGLTGMLGNQLLYILGAN